MTAITHLPAFRAAESEGRSAGPIIRLLQALALWRERARERRDLMAMDARLLKDIGLSSVDAWREANKPFWRP